MTMSSRVPPLSQVCIAKIVKDIKSFCSGTSFEELANCPLIIGPLLNLCKC